ncbi:MAG: hypothetical protein AAF558_13245 [Verrucomicrobiota bacterium]
MPKIRALVSLVVLSVVLVCITACQKSSLGDLDSADVQSEQPNVGADAQTPETEKQKRERLFRDIDQNFRGFHRLFAEEDLKFKATELSDKIDELFDDYHSKSAALGLAKLELFLEESNADEQVKTLELFRKAIPVDDDSNAKLYQMLFRYLGEVDGAGAMEYAMGEFPDNLVKLDSASEAMRSLAKQDPQLAATTAQELDEGYGKDYVIYAVPYEFVETDPNAALEWAGSLPGQYRKTAIQHTIMKWLTHDQPSAIQHLTELAGEEASQQFDTVLYSEAAHRLVVQDIQKSLEWVDKLPGGAARQESLATIVDWWAGSNPKAVSDWMGKVAPSKEMDPVFYRFTESIAWHDPNQARRWVNSITDQTMRERSLARIDDISKRREQ